MQNPRDLCKSGPRNEGLIQSFSRWHMVNFVYKLGPGCCALLKKDYVFSSSNLFWNFWATEFRRERKLKGNERDSLALCAKSF